MGLFDEAIREHLELKRRHGADLQEIARIERDTLGRGVRAADVEPVAGRDEPPVDLDEPPVDLGTAVPLSDGAGSWGDRAHGAHIDQDAQETAEMDIALAATGRQIGLHDGAIDHGREFDWTAVAAEQSEEFEWETPRSAGRWTSRARV